MIFIKAADDSGGATALWRTPAHTHVGDWSPDGTVLTVMVSDSQTQGDIWTVPLDASVGPRPWLNTRSEVAPVSAVKE